MMSLRHLLHSGRRLQRASCCLLCTHSAPHPIAPGDVLRLEHTFLQDDVRAYAAIAGDSNPIHTSPAAAASAGFSACLVPGMLCASLFPSLFASHVVSYSSRSLSLPSQHFCLPGVFIFAHSQPGSRIESETLRFKDPLFVGDCIEAEAKVLSVCSTEKCLRIEFNMECYKKQGKLLVLEGKSEVIVPQF